MRIPAILTTHATGAGHRQGPNAGPGEGDFGFWLLKESLLGQNTVQGGRQHHHRAIGPKQVLSFTQKCLSITIGVVRKSSLNS